MTDAPPDIVETTHLAAPPEVAWTFLTDPEHVTRWLGCLGYEKKVGHLFHIQPDPERREAGDVEGATHCRVLALEEADRFAFSWFLPGTPETEVTVELEGRGADATEVRLTHTGWHRFDPDEIRPIRDSLERGWRSDVLPRLRSAVEAGAG